MGGVECDEMEENGIMFLCGLLSEDEMVIPSHSITIKFLTPKFGLNEMD